MNHSRNNLDDIFGKLDRYSEKIKTNVVYVGSQAAAEVFYREAKLNCPTSDHAHWFHGTQYRINGIKYFFEPGTLRNSVYQVQSKDNSGNGKATYHVAWNHRKCPYGFMVEFGTSHSPAVGFMRRSYMNGKPDALLAAKSAMSDYLEQSK